ncbi:coiled-coil domain-containing protein 42 like-2-like isoform X2 [Drosophila bipectinata]
MIKLQAEMLANAKRQAKVNSTRVRNMYKMQERLRKRFIEVNSFIKDCVDKKRAAEKITNEETIYHRELGEGIESFTGSIGELKAFREALKATVQEFQPYEKVLDEVVNSSQIFESQQDCIDRCDALMLAQVESTQLEQQTLGQVEDVPKRMLKLTNEAALTVLGLKNDLSRLERSYNEFRVLGQKWEKILAKSKLAISTNYMDKNRTMDAVSTLYRTLCRRGDVSGKFNRNEFETQIDGIKEEVEILSGVLKIMEASDSAAKLEEARDKTLC